MKINWRTWLGDYGLFLIVAILLVSGWEWIVSSGMVPSFILPSPTEIGAALTDNRVLLFKVHLPATLKEVLIGFGLSLAGGLLLGVGMHFSRTLEKILYPFLVISQTIPLIAISPIFIMWFGYSIWSKIAVTILIAIFPIVVSTYDGLKAGGGEYRELLQTMGANRWTIFKKIQVPLALPSILSGLKMSVVYCVVGATIGEWLGASEGLGYFSRRMSGNLKADAVFAAIFLLSLIGIVLFLCISFIEKYLLKNIIRN
ncbi:binding-protein-dependent transport systems inner membrane component [Neobacillus bataviensis LMG 21833]|uniref:Binding-protein-dependent transport systems inner membrane component n=1 Tax=Neobacillus bataviensis LMG 21833 TaxID=1117379 RepID=K6CI22_9BACI|nr:ABC transporter permease [Neobacillus bataviensis]EKN70805.1 binding-protein-dependent transport systems inner membrane component [Neobacillus bataviensis LMG 21833]